MFPAFLQVAYVPAAHVERSEILITEGEEMVPEPSAFDEMHLKPVPFLPVKAF